MREKRTINKKTETNPLTSAFQRRLAAPCHREKEQLESDIRETSRTKNYGNINLNRQVLTRNKLPNKHLSFLFEGPKKPSRGSKKSPRSIYQSLRPRSIQASERLGGILEVTTISDLRPQNPAVGAMR